LQFQPLRRFLLSASASEPFLLLLEPFLLLLLEPLLLERSRRESLAGVGTKNSQLPACGPPHTSGEAPPGQKGVEVVLVEVKVELAEVEVELEVEVAVLVKVPVLVKVELLVEVAVVTVVEVTTATTGAGRLVTARPPALTPAFVMAFRIFDAMEFAVVPERAAATDDTSKARRRQGRS